MTHTHVGRKPNVAYQTRGKLFGHSSFKAGKSHALNLSAKRYRCYESVCGELVDAEYESDCGQFAVRDHVKPASEGKVTCKRCLAMIRKAESLTATT